MEEAVPGRAECASPAGMHACLGMPCCAARPASACVSLKAARRRGRSGGPRLSRPAAPCRGCVRSVVGSSVRRSSKPPRSAEQGLSVSCRSHDEEEFMSSPAEWKWTMPCETTSYSKSETRQGKPTWQREKRQGWQRLRMRSAVPSALSATSVLRQPVLPYAAHACVLKSCSRQDKQMRWKSRCCDRRACSVYETAFVSRRDEV